MTLFLLGHTHGQDVQESSESDVDSPLELLVPLVAVAEVSHQDPERTKVYRSRHYGVCIGYVRNMYEVCMEYV